MSCIMFQPETEDMLPRCAPKPSVPLDMNTAAIVRPTVPEVSILFGAQQATNATPTNVITMQQPQQQTYAAWKKQVLPKVTFPPAGSEVYSINGHVVSAAGMSSGTNGHAAISSTETTTNLYPLRPVSVNVGPMPTTANSNANHFVSGETQMQQHRRIFDQPQYIQQHMQENIQRRSIGSCTGISYPYPQAPVPERDVLSICAGTQTDTALLMDPPSNILPTHLANLVTKDELQHVFTLLGEMRTDQMRIMEALETLIAQQQTCTTQPTVLRHDAGTQYTNVDYQPCYEKHKQFPRIGHGGMEDYNILPTENDRYQPIKDMRAYLLDSPRQPAAQSTAYQPHTPTNSAPIKTNVVLGNKKANTEKSMLMNELAMKYLPNEQLNELLQELNIAPAELQRPSTPLKPIENVERRPSDISNASYKYLKKYRLLPEEHDESKERLRPSNSPLAEVDRQQQQQQHKSPYQHRTTPRVNTPQQSPMLDLENIRRQPKLI